ncbi:carboxymuconolactone decarboxylase family protein [Reyranella sp.]|uniref:carboxymuconolactone decarboxylase family protein n=1 Tax=Reyranella sp. TaxID=1929291 RepID=UPI0025F6B67C|nr:carboxymuconolactone decarboxylase family protein [Reyranella sp.]
MDKLKPLIGFAMAAHQGLDPTIVRLVEIRASQINGCAVCLAMHSREARQAGESEERIILLDAFRESELYSDRERAALEWTEALTRLEPGGASYEVYANLKAHFSEDEQVKLTLSIGAINAFNRLNVGFRVSPAVLKDVPKAA